MKTFLFLEHDDVIRPGDEIRMTFVPYDDGWGPDPKNPTDWARVIDRMPACAGITCGALLSRYAELGIVRSDGKPSYEVRRPGASSDPEKKGGQHG